MKQVIFLFVIFIYPSTYLFSQSQPCPISNNQWQWPTHTNWYFGEAKKITFGTSGSSAASVSTITGSGSPFTSYESCASASDENGNLVIFTNGVGVWNGAGAAVAVPGGGLLTGAEVTGGGAGSAVQGVLIVKHPLDVDNYYIFTTDDAIAGQDWNATLNVAKAPVTYGFNYYVYKKSTNTITGPTRLKDAGGQNYRSTEQVAATFHSNGIDLWIVTHEATPITAPKNQTVSTKNYFAYKLTCSGLTTTPVVSNLGFAVTVGSDWQGHSDRSNERSSLQFSWDGTKAGATHHRGNGAISGVNACVSIMNFNSTTGVLSNSVPINGTTIDVSNPYDCEFSPSGNRLYVTFLSSPWDNPAINGKVVYYNLAAGNSYNLVSNISTTVDGGIIKLGGDGKMYVGSFGVSPWAYRNAVGVVTNPDGAATFNASGLAAGNASVSYGLPNIFVPPRDYLKIRDTSITECQLPLDMGVTWKCKGTNAEDITTPGWSIKGTPAGGSINANNGVFNATAPGVYEVYYTICTIKDTALITVTSCSCPVDLKNEAPKICIGSQIKLDTTVLGGPGIWSIDSVPTSLGTNPTLTISGGDTIFTTVIGNKTGIYKLLFKDATDPGCRDSIYITVKAIPTVSLTDKSICTGDPAVTFDAGANKTSYSWTGPNSYTSSTNPISVSTAGTYSVTVDSLGCTKTGSATLTVKVLPTVSMQAQSICPSQSATFDAGANKTSYSWTGPNSYTSSTNPISVNKAGTYNVSVDSNGCTNTGSVVLTVKVLPTVNMAAQSICFGQNATFDAGVNKTSYSWTGPGGFTSSSNPITVSTAGTYTATVDSNGCSNAGSAILTIKALPSVNMSAQTICTGQTATFNAGANKTSYSWTGPGGYTSAVNPITVSTAGTYTATVDSNGCSNSGSAVLTVNPKPTVSMSGQTICSNQSAVFDAGANKTSYSWTGPGGYTSTDNPITVSAAGTYTATVDSNGCSNSGSAVLTVNPAKNATLSVKDTTACVTDPNIDFTPFPAQAGGTWTILSPAGSAGVIAGSFNPANYPAGDYVIEYSLADPCGDKDTLEVHIIDQFDATISTTKPTVCQSDTAYTITKVMAGGTWSATCGSCIDNTGKFYPALATPGVNTITYAYSSSNCGDTKTLNITVLPVFTSVISSDTSLCPNQSFTLTAGWQPSIPVVPGYTVSGSWKLVNGGAGLNAATGYFDAAVAGLGTFDVTYVVSGYPCIITDTVTITDLPIPSATITGDSTVCANLPGVQLTSSGDPGVWWDVLGKVSSSGSFSAAGAAVGNYPIEYRMDNGACKDTVHYNVRVMKVPVTDFVADKLIGCAPLTINFTDDSEEIPLFSDWQFDSSINHSSSIGSGSFTFSNPGIYSVSLTNTYSNSCVSMKNRPGYITALSLPTADFTSTPDLINTLSPFAVFYDQSSKDVVSWMWDFTEKGTPQTSTQDSPSNIQFSSDVDDTIPVRLIVSNGYCEDTVIHDVYLKANTLIFVPNAFTPNNDGQNDEFLPKGVNFGDKGYEFVVFDRWGEVIFKTNNPTEPWRGKRNNNMRDAQIDVYVWRVTYVDHFSGIKQTPIVGHVSLIR